MSRKTKLIRYVFGFLVTLSFGANSAIACRIDVSRYVGWTIVYSGTVTGYITDDGVEEDSFEGCEYGRVLIIDYNKQLICQTYSYSYSYYPNIVVLDNGGSREACINNNMYNVR